MGTSRINDYTLDVYYRDQNALELKGVTDLLGKMPEAENEIWLLCSSFSKTVLVLLIKLP